MSEHRIQGGRRSGKAFAQFAAMQKIIDEQAAKLEQAETFIASTERLYAAQASILDTLTEMHRVDTDYGTPHLCGHCLRQWPCIDAQTLRRGQE